MIIEKNDLFCVIRGPEYLAVGPEQVELAPYYRRTNKRVTLRYSYDGVVFLANEVCYPLIAATVVAPDEAVGETAVFNMMDIEAMTVTPRFASVLGYEPETETQDGNTLDTVLNPRLRKRHNGDNPRPPEHQKEKGS